MKWQLILVAILTIQLAQACIVQYDVDDNITIYDDIETAGVGADCNITLYANNSFYLESPMTMNGASYYLDAGVLPAGIYTSGIECNKSYNATVSALYLDECKFEVSEDEKMNTMLIGSVVIWLLGMAVTYYLFSKTNRFLAAFGTFLVSILGFLIASQFGIDLMFPGVLSTLLLAYVGAEVAYAVL